MERPTRRAVLVAGGGLVTGSGLLAGCSSVPILGSGSGGFEVTERWQSWQYDWQNSGRAADITGPSGSVSVAWKRKIGPGNGGASPVVGDGTVFVGSGDGTFYALEAGTGDTRWQARTGKWIHSTAAVDDDFVVFGSDDFNVRAYHWDGSERWSFRANFEVSADPVLTADRVYVTDTDSTVYALNRADGRPDWTKTLEVTSGGHLGSPVLADGDVVVSGGTRIWRLSADDGSVTWTTDIDGSTGVTVTVADGTIVGVQGSGIESPGQLFGIDPATGDVSWRRELFTGYISDPAIADGSVYLSAVNGLAARSLSDGTVSWQVSLGGQSGTPVVVGGTVYCLAGGAVHALSPDGKSRWRASVEFEEASSLAAASGTLFCKSGSTVYALR